MTLVVGILLASLGVILLLVNMALYPYLWIKSARFPFLWFPDDKTTLLIFALWLSGMTLTAVGFALIT